MPRRTSKTGSELFIVDNSDDDWKVQRYLHDWCQLSTAIDVANGYRLFRRADLENFLMRIEQPDNGPPRKAK